MNTISENDGSRASRKRNRFAQIPILAVVLFSLFIVLPVSAQSLLWEVKSDTATVYLFGSVHYAKSDMYPLDAVVENSFEKSSILVLELDPTSVDQAVVLQQVMSKGMYSGDKTIKDEISSEVYAMLEEYLKSTNRTEEELREDLRTLATKRVTRSLVLDKVADEEKIEVSDSEIDDEITKMTENSTENKEQIQAFWSTPEARQSVKQFLTTRKTVQQLVEIAGGPKMDTKITQKEEGK